MSGLPYDGHVDDEGLRPDPEHVIMFREKPEEAAGVYRQLFLSQEDRKLLAFMYAFPFEDPTPLQQKSLWLSGFPLALLDGLTDERWYESFKDMAGDFEFGHFATTESVRWYSLLLLCQECC